MSAPEHSRDWLFDYILSVMSSPTWDAHIMNFVDEHCVIFDNEEENKFEHWDVYTRFKERVEALLESMLLEVNVSSEELVDACERGRHSCEVNRRAFAHLLALDDYLAFKKMMVRRNMDLELEAIQRLQQQQRGGGEVEADEDDEDAMVAAAVKESLRLAQAPDAAKASPDAKEAPADHKGAKDEDKATKVDLDMAQAMSVSLLEMEIMHKQERMEQLELEQVLAMSLALEEERLRVAREEAEAGAANLAATVEAKDSVVSDAKEVSPKFRARSGSKALDVDVAVAVPPATSMPARARSLGVNHAKAPTVAQAQVATDAGDLAAAPAEKPRALQPLRSSSRTNSLGSVPTLSDMEDHVRRKKAEAEEHLRRNEERHEEQLRQEEELKRQAQVSKADMQRRASYLKAQRDRIIAQKKREREEKAARYEADRSEASPKSGDAPVALPKPRLNPELAGDDKGDQESKAATEQRNAMRLALARKMKQDLLQNQERRLAQQHVEQIGELDQKLKEVEDLRDANRRKEEELARLLQLQQQHRGRVLVGVADDKY